MNIEFRFLQKAILDKNFISFTYENKNFRSIKPLKLDDKNNLYSDKGTFQLIKIKKLQILKDKYSN
jgi:predicted DNA-binding transcriptional regulator YafY